MPRFLPIALLVFAVGWFGAAHGAHKKSSAHSAPKAAKAAKVIKAHKKHPVHHLGKTKAAVKHPAKISGKAHTGKASFYSHRLAGHKMANGERMNPNSNNAASKTLPLGTQAKVTNLNNGKSAVVVIKDHGPHVKGRVIDLSPATARLLGAVKHGVVPVQVTPLKTPQSGGKRKPAKAAA